MMAGFLTAILFSGNWTVFVYMGMIGSTFGLASTIKSALWAELYGTEMIGTVQSLFSSIRVFSTAVSPFFVGWMLDQSISFNTILLIATISCVVSGLISVRVFPALQRYNRV